MAFPFTDSFTDTDGVGVASHTPNTAGAWVLHASYSTGLAVIATNRVRTNSVNQGLWYANVSPATAEYDVEADIIPRSLISGSQVGVCARTNSSANTMYYLRYRPAINSWELGTLVNGTSVVLGTFAQTLTLDQAYHVKLEIRDATKKVFIDGVERISSADNSITAAGFAAIRFLETGASNTAGIHIDNFSATDVPTGPPVNTVAPAITTDGTPATGETISCSTGTWTLSPTGYTYQWKRAGSAISGATSSSYTLVTADEAQSIKCTVTATNGGGSTSQDSDTITPAVSVPTNTAAPVISGVRVVGSTLSTTNGSWNGSPTSYAYQWKRDGANISGATAGTYVLVSGDAGHTVTCDVTATNAGGASSPAGSNGLAVVAEIVAGDVQFWTSANGIGGSPGVQIPAPTSVFDAVTFTEAAAGDDEYRAVYIKNTHAVRSLTVTLAWIATQTSSPTTDLAIGVAPQPAGTDVTATADESTPPAGVTFSAPATEGAGISIGTLGPGQARGIWLRRHVAAGTIATAADTSTLGWSGTPS